MENNCFGLRLGYLQNSQVSPNQRRQIRDKIIKWTGKLFQLICTVLLKLAAHTSICFRICILL